MTRSRLISGLVLFLILGALAAVTLRSPSSSSKPAANSGYQIRVP